MRRLHAGARRGMLGAMRTAAFVTLAARLHATLRPARPAALHWLLPPTCLLCGAPGHGEADLCTRCRAELPRNHSCCKRCALPLAVAAEACGDCLRHPRPWDGAWVPFRYAWPLNLLETRFKFSAGLACGRALTEAWRDAGPPLLRPDCIVPVPLHRQRLRQRGYNQALELARPLARAWDLVLRVDLLERIRATSPQSELDAVRRRRNLRRAFAVRAGVALPHHVALLDDVMTTGATLAECTRSLKRAGVGRVDVWALARAP